MDKTLGILGFGRIGQLVAQRAQGFGMRVVAFDPFVGAERYRELGVEKAESSDERLRRRPTSSPSTCPRRPRPRAGSTPRRSRSARTACAILNVARGPLIVDEDLEAALDSRQGRRRGARRLPLRADHRAPALRLPQRRRHAAPRRLDRGGDRPRRLPGRRAGRRRAHRRQRDHRGQRPGGGRRGPRGARAVPAALPRSSAASRWRWPRARRSTASRSSSLGRIAERDTRPLAIAALLGVLAGHTEEERQRGQRARRSPRSAASRSSRPSARARATSPTSSASPSSAGERARARRRHDARPPQPPAPARGLGPALQPPARATHLALFRYRDVPGMIGRVGTAFGEPGVNIGSAAVGRRREGDGGGEAGDGRHDRRAGPARGPRRDRRARRLHDGRSVSL